jgi:hypothetical protein
VSLVTPSHINMYNARYGVSVVSQAMGYISGFNHEFYSAGVLVLQLTTDVSYLYSHLYLDNHTIYGLDECRVSTGSYSNPKFCFTGYETSGLYFNTSVVRVGITVNGNRRALFNNDNNIYFLTGTGAGTTRFQIAPTSIISYSNITPDETNGVTCGTSGLAWGQTYSYGYTDLSDRRIKKDIEAFDIGLSFINKLDVKSYKWLDDAGGIHNRTHVGLIAQDVANVVSSEGLCLASSDFVGNEYLKKEGITETESFEGEQRSTDDIYTLKYNALFCCMINSIKELTIKNNLLEDRIAALELAMTN